LSPGLCRPTRWWTPARPTACERIAAWSHVIFGETRGCSLSAGPRLASFSAFWLEWDLRLYIKTIFRGNRVLEIFCDEGSKPEKGDWQPAGIHL
jgi:hypothetical protein